MCKKAAVFSNAQIFYTSLNDTLAFSILQTIGLLSHLIKLIIPRCHISRLAAYLKKIFHCRVIRYSTYYEIKPCDWMWQVT